MSVMNIDLGPDGCMYNYVVTAHKPTNVTQTVVGHFTSASHLNLIVSKCTRIEIHTLTTEGLQGVVDVPIYGRISVLELFRPANEPKDLLFIATDGYTFCVLEYDESTGELVTRANGNLEDTVGRPADNGQLGVIDPQCRMIGLHLYDGMLKVIPIDDKGQLQEAFNIRLEELNVIDMKFLEGCARPTLAVLYADQKESRHIKTYEVVMKDKDFGEGPWHQQHLDAAANLIIPVPAPFGGAIVVGESMISYFSDRQPQKTVSISQTVVRAYGRVDEDGSRYLLGDHLGNLFLLVLSHDGERVRGLKMEKLGVTSPASTISYLDNGVVFIGSSFADSQLVKLHATAPTPEDPHNYVEVLDSITNLGPIIDFCVVDLDRQGQGQVVTCSGVGDDGSLRVVRNGIGVIEQAAVELAGIRGVWSLRGGSGEEYDKYLLLTFVGETRVLEINAQDELDEAEISGFDGNAQTLWCGNVAAGQMLQVTATSARLVSCATQELACEWKPPNGMSINLAAASPTQLLVGVGGGHLSYIHISAGVLQEQQHTQLGSEVACLDVTPLGADSEHSSIAAVGCWDMTLNLYSLPSLTLLTSVKVGSDVIPRSTLLAEFGGIPYLLVAMGDGQLINYRIDTTTGVLSERKNVSLGTKPLSLHTFQRGGVRHVFAASDRPTIIYSNNGKLLYSNLNENEVTHVASFHSASFPDSLAISKEGSLTIGGIDEIQKLHIRTVPLGEQPRRIAHQESTRTFAVLTTQQPYGSGPDDPGVDYVRLLDEQTFDTVDRQSLDEYEACCSVCSATLAEEGSVYYVVGTAYALPEEEEPSKGRILVYQVVGSKLTLVAEKEVKGAVYCLLPFQGKLLACINNRVALYKWTQREDGSRELVNECSHAGQVIALFAAARGDFIVVGDLMKSIQLLLYKGEEGSIELRASDYNANWMTAVGVLDEDVYIGAENNFNLYTVRKNSDAANDDERSRLETCGQYHLGDMVNRFRRGCLVMQLPDSEAVPKPTMLFGTVNGALGVIVSLTKTMYLFLEKLQDCLRGVVKGVGGFDHARWRTFVTHIKLPRLATNFIDGDLIEQFLDLKSDSMDKIAAQMGTSVDEIYQVVEELSRLH